jgi:streptogramin lyase
LTLIFAGCDKEVSRSPIESEPPKGLIYVNSNPKGFMIFQDGRNTGRVTPDSISFIEAGVYEITLKKKYFKDTSLVVTLNENEKLNLNVDIFSNPSMYGGLYLQTIPTGASITLNDSVLNKVTPLSLQSLSPGEYRIKFNLFNHRDSEIIAIVQSSNINNYIKELRDTSEWIDYQVFNSGIQSNSLTAIAIDNMNMKWIGTLDKGLIKYDEVNFIDFNTTNSSIPANKINCIALDNQNRVWVGTDFGIGIFNGSGWITYNRSNSGLTSELIYAIRFDEIGNAWIGTAANLLKFDGNNWIVYNDPLETDWITDIYIESINKLWLGTKSNGIYIFENESFIPVLQPDYGYPSKTISSIGVDVFNNIWFCFLPDTAGRGGVSYWNGAGFTNFLLGTPQNNVNNIFIDDKNNKWFATTEGFVLFDAQNNSIVFKTSNSLISANNVRASLLDQNGIVWITTIGGGLNKLKFFDRIKSRHN